MDNFIFFLNAFLYGLTTSFIFKVIIKFKILLAEGILDEWIRRFCSSK